jgi:large subunit ribosomal protein L14
MIQIGSFLNVVDNSGAKKVMCIQISNSGYRQRYGGVGSLILVSIKSIRFSKNMKVKKGSICRAVIVKTKTASFSFSFNYRNFLENAVVLLNAQNKLIGTRVFGVVPKQFKYSKFLKLTTLSSGVSL